jgi:amino acid adenylation domain-containing protein
MEQNSVFFCPARIDQQAHAHPQKVALMTDSGGLSYAELQTRSNQLAHRLRALGVGREALVGLCFHRSIEFVVAALAVWKAGAAYVPLDPEYPLDRIALMIEDAGLSVILSDSTGAANLPQGNFQIVLLDRDAAYLASLKNTPPEIDLDEDLLAYVIFTSGSTGRPNGVEITHRNLANLIQWHLSTFGITTLDRGMFASSPGFDAAVWEVWPYLAAGAALHLPDETTRHAPELLRDWMVDHRITIGFVAAPFAESMITLPWPPQTDLRTLLTGADTLHRFPSRDLPFCLVNNYGPTECTVVATSGCVPHEGAQGHPSIGKPISNTQVRILDAEGRPVARGEEGEIYIGGASVARGYRNRPSLTAERFVADPFTSGAGSRLYRTGDRARELPNGEIAFLGRQDDQVKMSGYRIELGEIASMLIRHPMVRAAEVAPERNCTGVARLVAYVVLHAGERPAASDLQEFLRAHLPHYMVPFTYVAVDALPLTPHGKVDRAQLPQPGPTNRLRDARPQAKSAVEEGVVDVLAAALRNPEIGLNDNFFEFGGHSLLGTQLITQLRERFGVELGLRTLFANPTAAGLSAQIETLILARLSAPATDSCKVDLR